MDKQKQIEAMARLEFGEAFYKATRSNSGAFIFCHDRAPVFREYLTDHNAVARVIDGLSEEELSDYWGKLMYEFQVTLEDLEWDGAPRMARATPAQKVEAILKAKGEWKDD